MTETTDNTTPEAAAGNSGQPGQPVFAIQRIYLKDVSFETPMGLTAFAQNTKPKIQQELNVQVERLEGDRFEVVLLITITASIEERTAFLVEIKQAGLFHMAGFEAPQLSQIINSNCPQILFPYAREAIDSVLSRGGFAPLMLPPINFDAVFAQAVAQARQQAGAQQSESPATN